MAVHLDLEAPLHEKAGASWGECSDRVIIAASGLGHLKEGEFGTHCHIRDEFYS